MILVSSWFSALKVSQQESFTVKMSQSNLPAYILNLLGFTNSSKHSSKKRSDCEDSEPADLSNMVRKLVLDNHRRVETARAEAEKQPPS